MLEFLLGSESNSLHQLANYSLTELTVDKRICDKFCGSLTRWSYCCVTLVPTKLHPPAIGNASVLRSNQLVMCQILSSISWKVQNKYISWDFVFDTTPVGHPVANSSNVLVALKLSNISFVLVLCFSDI